MANVDIDKIIRKLLVKSPPFGIILENANIIESPSAETAETDGQDIYYNKDFLASLSEEEQVFILAHEISHICLDHIDRSEGKDPDTWNIATDAIINVRLVANGYKMPKGVIDMPEAKDYDSESFYEKLKKENKNQKEKKDDRKNRGSHKHWKEAVDKKKNNFQNKKTQGLDEAKKKFSQMGEKKFFDHCQKEKQRRLEDLRKELARDSNPNRQINSINLGDIGIQKQMVDWKRLLIECSKNDHDWSYQNIMIEDGILKPSLLEEIESKEVEILLDTSGSVSETLLKNFLRECKNIFSNSKIKVGCFDTKFYGFSEIRQVSDIDEFEIIGRGGTDFDAAVNAFSKNIDNKIIFTDGDANMPSKRMNITWIVFGGQKINPLGGRVIHIDNDSLRDLYIINKNYESKKIKTK